MTSQLPLTIRGFQTWHLKEPSHEYWVFCPFHIGWGYNVKGLPRVVTGCFDITIMGLGITIEWPKRDNDTRAQSTESI